MAVTLLAAALAVIANAQQPAAPVGAVAGASEPGKAAIVGAVEMSAQVVAIEKANRTLMLKGPKGNVVDIVAGEQVKNFDQIKVGDFVVARYAQALTLELRKARAAGGEAVVKEEEAKAKAGEKPSVAGARSVTLLADVVGVDHKASTITLKGPKGNEVTLDVRNPEQFKVVKKGDQVEVTYTEALALSVEQAPKAAAPAKK